MELDLIRVDDCSFSSSGGTKQNEIKETISKTKLTVVIHSYHACICMYMHPYARTCMYSVVLVPGQVKWNWI